MSIALDKLSGSTITVNGFTSLPWAFVAIMFTVNCPVDGGIHVISPVLLSIFIPWGDSLIEKEVGVFCASI